MSSPTVSVLITTYNREKYLAAAIESVLAQTFADFELVIVDDKSADGSVEIARRYEKDPRMRIHVNERNLGDYPNRNKAASLARGKYLKYVDADDVIYPHCLGVMVQGMERYPEAGLGISKEMHGIVCPGLITSREAYLDHFYGGGLFTVGPLDTIIRRDAFEKAGGFSPARHVSDYECWAKLARNDPVAILTPGLAWWRCHDEQESLVEHQTFKLIAAMAGKRLRIALCALDAPDCPLAEAERNRARERVLAGFSLSVGKALLHGNPLLACALLIESGVGLYSLTQSALRRAARKLSNELAEDPTVARRGVERDGLSTNRFLPTTTVGRLEPQSRRSTNAVASQSRAFVTPLVSVLIPASNADSCIARSIESVRAQSFSDWELIIVDDASTDHTAEIARSYADGDRIRCFRNGRNLGKWVNHNHCVEMARGKYLKFLHADDVLYPHCLEIMVELMERQPGAGMGISGACGSYRAGVALDPLTALRSEFFGTPRFLEGMTALIIRSEAFKELGGIEPAAYPAERLFQLRLANRYPVVLMDRGLVYYRRYSSHPYLGFNKWYYNWAEGYSDVIAWLQSPGIVLSEEERCLAIGNMLRYVWRRGDVFHPRSIRQVGFGERVRVLQLGRQAGIPWYDFVLGPPRKRGWTLEMEQQVLQQTSSMPNGHVADVKTPAGLNHG